MFESDEIVVIRLGHRPGRDERTTTHVGLTARAFGADRIVIPSGASSTRATIEDVTTRFGGPFSVEQASDPIRWLAGWEDPIVHLTMYGLPVEEVVPDIRAQCDGGRLAVVVGGGKVSPDVFEQATWNVGVTNQPHSEIAALAVFLDRLHGTDLGDRVFEGAQEVVIPSASRKRVTTETGDE